MKYTMNVTITDPSGAREVEFNLRVFFDYEPKDYGNGHYVHIEADNFNEQYYDLRYDTSFNKDKKEEWLESWAKNYWSGKNGAWAVKSVEVTKA